MPPKVRGFRAAGVACGIKPSARADLALIASDRPASAAGLFTRNRFPGAPVIVSRARMRSGRAQVIVVNSGISNVATGSTGVRDAREMSAAAGRALGVKPAWVQVASTGVIGPPLPMDRVLRGVERAAASLSERGWSGAARAILTTDTKPKLASASGRGFGLVGIAKGAGMIMPDMATMLCFLATDAALEPGVLRAALEEAVAPSLNALTIDGETSTSDMVLLLANGAAGRAPLGARSPGARAFRSALRDLCAELAEKLALDGEGVTRLAEIEVLGARSDAQAERVARSVGNSMLFKTALFGRDPNWGRIVQAVGAAGVPFRPADLAIQIGDTLLLEAGEPCGGPRAIARAERTMKRKRVRILIRIGRGRARARLLTTDLSYEYIRINAEYTT